MIEWDAWKRSVIILFQENLHPSNGVGKTSLVCRGSSSKDPGFLDFDAGAEVSSSLGGSLSDSTVNSGSDANGSGDLADAATFPMTLSIANMIIGMKI